MTVESLNRQRVLHLLDSFARGDIEEDGGMGADLYPGKREVDDDEQPARERARAVEATGRIRRMEVAAGTVVADRGDGVTRGTRRTKTRRPKAE